MSGMMGGDKMLRVGICDDNISEIKHIENMLEQFFHTIDAADSEIEVRK